MDSEKITQLPSLVVTKKVSKTSENVYKEPSKAYKDYCPACNEYVIPDKSDRCPNKHCRWALR